MRSFHEIKFSTLASPTSARTGMQIAGNPHVFSEAEDKHGSMRKRGGKARAELPGPAEKFFSDHANYR